MRTASISSAKNRLSALLQEVQGGAIITITDRGVPVARLVPVRPAKGIPARAIALAQAGRLTLPDRQPTTDWLDLPLPVPSPGASAVQALLKEREEGR